MEAQGIAEFAGWQSHAKGKSVMRGFRLSVPFIEDDIEYHSLQVFSSVSVLGNETIVYGLGAGEEIGTDPGNELHRWKGLDWRGIVEIGLGYEIQFL